MKEIRLGKLTMKMSTIIKILAPIATAGLALVGAVIHLINPYNIIKIAKNNYTNLAK